MSPPRSTVGPVLNEPLALSLWQDCEVLIRRVRSGRQDRCHPPDEIYCRTGIEAVHGSAGVADSTVNSHVVTTH